MTKSRNFTFKQDYITEEPEQTSQPHTKDQKCCTGNPAPRLPSYDLPTLYTTFSLPTWKALSHHPLLQRNQEKPNKKFKSWFRHPPQVWFYEDENPQRQRGITLSVGVSSCMYNGWVKARFCDLRLNWYSHAWTPMNMV